MPPKRKRLPPPARLKKDPDVDTDSDDDEGNNNAAQDYTNNSIGALLETSRAPESAQQTNDNLLQELQDLHQEMEFAVHTRTTDRGQLRRKVSKQQSKLNTRKRRELERQDVVAAERHSDSDADRNHEPRRRGAQAAQDLALLEQSRVFGGTVRTDEESPDEDTGGNATTDDQSEVDDDGDDGAMSMDECDENDSSEGDESGADTESGSDHKTSRLPTGNHGGSRSKESRITGKRSSTAGSSRSRIRRTSRRSRMRNFRSYRMAQKHGEALGAHARGQAQLAIAILKQIAREAPSAPQVYSSLGMIYEDLLEQVRRSSAQNASVVVDHNRLYNNDHDPDEETVPDNEPSPTQVPASIQKQLHLARKAYGAYHVAAILCKQDYALWVRAADMAMEMVDLYDAVLAQSEVRLSAVPAANGTDKSLLLWCNDERTKWLKEALEDYQKADLLNPPDIDVPAKLATILIEVGQLSEALTLMTELKNRTRMRSSYRCWLLFADLMSRIGAECEKWNKGDQRIKNYMFRRWLKKYAATFDWEERRVHALIKALEAASGSASCQALIGQVKDDSMATVDALLSQQADSKPTQAADDSTADNLPVTASCRTVCKICLALQQYTIMAGHYNVARLAGDAVSKYFRIRAEQLERKAAARLHLDRIQQLPTSIFALQQESYDTANIPRDEESDSDVALSDEDDSDGSHQWRLSLERGTLPPDLLTMCGLSMLLEGGRDYLARKCLQGILVLPQENLTWYEERSPAISKPGTFSESELGRTECLAFVVDAIRGTCYEERFSESLRPLFDNQVQVYATSNLLKLAFGPPQDTTRYNADRLNAVRVVSLAAHRLWLYDNRPNYDFFQRASQCIGNTLEFLEASNLSQEHGVSTAVLVDLLSTMDRAFERMGTIDQTCAERLYLLSNYLGRAVAILCSIDKESLIEQLDGYVPNMLTQIPLISAWQSSSQRAISERCFSLCASLNLHGVSGWEDGDLYPQMREQITKSNGCTLRVEAGVVGGFLPSYLQDRLLDMWQTTPRLAPILPEFNVAGRLARLQNNERYQDTRLKFVNENGENFVGTYGEAAGLSILMRYAAIVMKNGSNTIDMSYGAIFSGLSVLLPLSQFVIGDEIWCADVGKVGQHQAVCFQEPAISIQALMKGGSMPVTQFQQGHTVQNGVEGRPNGHVSARAQTEHEKLDHTTTSNDEAFDIGLGGTKQRADTEKEEFSSRSPSVSDRQRITKRRFGPAESTKKSKVVDDNGRTRTPLSLPVTRLFNEEYGESLLNSIVQVSCSSMQNKWDSFPTEDTWYTGNSVDAMKQLHQRLDVLRRCKTERAAERTVLEVARAILNMCGTSNCPQRFACIQRAAALAQCGGKLGNGDVYFHHQVPLLSDCTPLDALLILGRADCLQGIMFCKEAAFLCDFVARVVANKLSGYESGMYRRHWEIVGAVMYNVSVLIRHTVERVISEEQRDHCRTFSWSTTALAALRTGRSLALKLASEQ